MSDVGAMKRGTTVIMGVLLLLLGLVAFVYQGVTYKSREKIVDLGPIEATKETIKTVPLSPLLGGVAIVGGFILVVAGSRKY